MLLHEGRPLRRRNRALAAVAGTIFACALLATPATASAQASPPAGTETRTRAASAFGHFADGLATGRWQPFLDLMADDFTFSFPMGKYVGEHAGTAKAAEFFAYVRSVYPDGLAVTLDRVTVDGDRAIFEFRSEGTLVLPNERRPYKNRVAVVFEFLNGKLAHYREYFGSDGKSY